MLSTPYLLPRLTAVEGINNDYNDYDNNDEKERV